MDKPRHAVEATRHADPCAEQRDRSDRALIGRSIASYREAPPVTGPLTPPPLLAQERRRCPDENTVVAYLDGRLVGERAREVDGHLDLCPSCRQIVAVLAATLFGQDEGSAATGLPATSPEPMDLRTVVEAPGRYTIQGERGRGGQAVVYTVFDEYLGREIALKLLRSGGLPGAGGSPRHRTAGAADGSIARFIREVRITSQLSHPSIVNVHEVGRREDGTIYYTMQLVRGQTLKAALEEGPDLGARLQLLNHFVDLCNGVAYAHCAGVLHRDLKPSNVMIGEFGATVILDWGLATFKAPADGAPVGAEADPADGSAADSADGARIGAGAAAGSPERSGEEARPPSAERLLRTRAGTALGTPSYMSPEQATGALDEIDERTDIWGLGAVLYELLAGHPPFEGISADMIIQQAQRDAVQPVASICPDAPPELTAVAEKSLSRRRSRRYASARELADDVTAYLSGRRVEAYRYSAWDLIKHFAARHRVLLFVSSAILLTIVAALVIVSVFHRREQLARASERRERLTASYYLAQAYRDRALRLLRQRRYLSARIYGSAALLNNPAHPGSRSHSPGFASSVPGSQQLSLHAASIVYQADAGPVQRQRTLATAPAGFRAIAFSPDGRLVLTGCNDGRLRLWKLETGELVRVIAAHRRPVYDVAFVEGGRLLASASRDLTLKHWDLRSGKLVGEPLALPNLFNNVTLSADGRMLAFARKDRLVTLWERGRGWLPGPGLAHDDLVFSMAFSHDRASLATAGKVVRVWSPSDGQLRATLRGHTDLVLAMAFAPGGRFLATAALDRTIKLWRVETGELIRSLRSEELPYSLAFSPDGRLLAAGLRSGAVGLWQAASGVHLATTKTHTDRVNALAFAPGGRVVASVGWDRAVKLTRLAPRDRPLVFRAGKTSVEQLSLSPDGRLLATAGLGPEISLWDARRGRPAGRLAGHGGAIWSMAFSADGRSLASGGRDKTVRIWDVRRRAPRAVLRGHGHNVAAVAFSPDGEQVASGGADGTVRLWSTRDSATLAVLKGHSDCVKSLAFSPDGRRLASGGFDRAVVLWDVARRRRTMRLAHDSWVTSVAFASSGSLLATGCRNGALRLWDASSGRPLRRLGGHGQWVNRTLFSTDGRLLVSSSDDQTLVVWSVHSGRARLVLQAEDSVANVGLFPDGRRLVYAEGALVRVAPLDLARLRVAPARLHAEALERAEMRLEGFSLQMTAPRAAALLRDR